MNMGTLKKWITDTLYDSAEYQAFCTETISSTLNFYRSAPVDDNSKEALPFLTVYSDSVDKDYASQQFWRDSFIIPIAIAIVGDDDSITDSNITVWNSSDKVELLALKAEEILLRQLSCGIGGEDIRVLRTQLVVSEIGYADDVQANMFITFGKPNSL